MKSQILMFVDLSKTQKSKSLEKETSFFVQVKIFIYYTFRTIIWQKNSVEVNFKFSNNATCLEDGLNWIDKVTW